MWPDVVVSDGSLTQAVFVVRRALGESEDGPGFLATVPRVGYRFSTDVRAIPRAEKPARSCPSPVAASAPGPMLKGTAPGAASAAARSRSSSSRPPSSPSAE